MERLATGPNTRFRYFCSPQHTDSALFPVISQLERAARFPYDDTQQAKLDKLDALLGQSATSRANNGCNLPRRVFLVDSCEPHHTSRLQIGSKQ